MQTQNRFPTLGWVPATATSVLQCFKQAHTGSSQQTHEHMHNNVWHAPSSSITACRDLISEKHFSRNCCGSTVRYMGVLLQHGMPAIKGIHAQAHTARSCWLAQASQAKQSSKPGVQILYTQSNNSSRTRTFCIVKVITSGCHPQPVHILRCQSHNYQLPSTTSAVLHHQSHH